MLGLLTAPLEIASGEIRLRGRDIATLDFEAMRAVRGKAMSIVFQDPMTSLNPVLSIGGQIAEAVRLHQPQLSRDAIRARVIELLALVGIPEPEQRIDQYPNEFSGGMRQRVMIAMAMANEPDLLIADEPTTALDVTIQAQVMRVLADIRRRTGAAMVLITHDLGLVAEHADRIAVMYGGRLMETSPGETIFTQPAHPYTAGLVRSLPRLERRATRLYSIPGLVPDPAQRAQGCVFHPRCAIAAGREACRTRVPALRDMPSGHRAACHFAEETAGWRAGPDESATPASADADTAETVLSVQGLNKQFALRRSWFGRKRTLTALRDVSFELRKGRTLGLVGESGCGKSTLARVLLRLLDASGGRVFLNGRPFMQLEGSTLRERRRDLQVVFQDPYSSLDPRMSVHEVIAEPLRIQGRYAPGRVEELLAHVGLPAQAAQRKPPEFSGGQRQRIAIARALALHPDVLILDEAVSALDVSIQAQIINLLDALQRDLGLAYVFISHDLSVVRHIADEVAVMYLGAIVEQGETDAIFDAPAHPYTQALLSAAPRPRGAAGERIILTGDLPDPLAPPSGCAFRTRCFRAQARCAGEAPALAPRTGPAHLSSCHFAGAAASAAIEIRG